MPAWLVQAHERLDRMVYAAYGWDYPLGSEEVLERLVELNLRRAQDASQLKAENVKVTDRDRAS